MSGIPENEVTMEDLMAWDAAVKRLDSEKARLKPLIAAEMMLRRRCFKGFFPTPKEGTNSYQLANDYVLKATYKIKRDLDDTLFASGCAMLKENGISTDLLFRFKPGLVTAEYRTLTEEQIHLVDQLLIIKPEAPEMEIVLPAKAKDKRAAEAMMSSANNGVLDGSDRTTSGAIGQP